MAFQGVSMSRWIHLIEDEVVVVHVPVNGAGTRWPRTNKTDSFQGVEMSSVDDGLSLVAIAASMS